jgi:acyl dehydratase
MSASDLLQDQIAGDLHFEELTVGQVFSVGAVLGESELNRFSALSGDYSPIHTDEAAARQCGFPGRVVCGSQVLSFLSPIAGRSFHAAVCASVSMDFTAPAFAGDRITVRAEMTQIQAAMRSVSLAVRVLRNENGPIARGRLVTRFL